MSCGKVDSVAVLDSSHCRPSWASVNVFIDPFVLCGLQDELTGLLANFVWHHCTEDLKYLRIFFF